MTHESNFYAQFSQSMTLKISSPSIIELLMRYLLEASQIQVVNIQVNLAQRQPEYRLYRIDLEVGGGCDREILDLVGHLNFPNIMWVDSVHLRRCAQLSSTDIQQRKDQLLKLPSLVCGKISVVWLSWQND